MKYFLHDSSASQDEKITELYMVFGYEGTGLFYAILEKIALQEKPIKTSVLKKQLSVGKKLDKCWCFMEEIGLISSNNGETFNKQLLNFSQKYQIKKEKNAKRISEWRERQEVAENVTHYESVRNTPKVKESKVNRSKGIIVPPTIEEVKEYFTEKGYSLEVAQKAFDYYSSAGWKDSNGKEVKSWKQKMISIWFKDENKNQQSKQAQLVY